MDDDWHIVERPKKKRRLWDYIFGTKEPKYSDPSYLDVIPQDAFYQLCYFLPVTDINKLFRVIMFYIHIYKMNFLVKFISHRFRT